MDTRQLDKIAKLSGVTVESLQQLLQLEEDTATYDPTTKVYEMGLVSKTIASFAAKKVQTEYASKEPEQLELKPVQ